MVAFDAGYVFWLAATEDGAVYTCNSQVGAGGRWGVPGGGAGRREGTVEVEA